VRKSFFAGVRKSFFATVPRGRDIAAGQQAGIRTGLVSWGAHEPEAAVRVAVAGRITVPVGRPAVPRVVVPTAAAKHPVRASGQYPHSIETSFNGMTYPMRKHA